MSQTWLERLSALDYISNHQHVKSDFCEHCQYGKQTRSPHSTHYEMIRQPLELIDNDIYEPMPERSRGGAQYFITFVDVCTRKVWAYSLKSKDEALETFARWITEAENRSGHKVKTSRSDNGGEYTSKAFKMYLFERGIRHQRTVPYTQCRMV